MNILPALIRHSDAPAYLGMCEKDFNKIVRPHIPEAQHKQKIFYSRLDLDEFAAHFMQANGKKDKEINICQKESQGYESKANSGTSKKLSPVSSFDAALAKRNLKKQKAS